MQMLRDILIFGALSLIIIKGAEALIHWEPTMPKSVPVVWADKATPACDAQNVACYYPKVVADYLGN